MKSELHTLTITGMTVRQIGKDIMRYYTLCTTLTDSTEEILDNTVMKGYPIVSNDDRNTLIGYIGRTELRYVLGKFEPCPKSFRISESLSTICRRQIANSTRHGR